MNEKRENLRIEGVLALQYLSVVRIAHGDRFRRCPNCNRARGLQQQLLAPRVDE
jgi:hypothetical protein